MVEWRGMCVCKARERLGSTSAGDFAADCPQSDATCLVSNMDKRGTLAETRLELEPQPSSMPTTTLRYHQPPLDMSARLSNIFAVTKPIVRDTAEQVQSCVRVAAALERAHAVRRSMLDDVERLQEEQDYWVKEWEVALVRGTSIACYAHTNHA